MRAVTYTNQANNFYSSCHTLQQLLELFPFFLNTSEKPKTLAEKLHDSTENNSYYQRNDNIKWSFSINAQIWYGQWMGSYTVIMLMWLIISPYSRETGLHKRLILVIILAASTGSVGEYTVIVWKKIQIK